MRLLFNLELFPGSPSASDHQSSLCTIVKRPNHTCTMEEADLRKAFKAIDKDQSGKLSAVELQEALKSIGHEIPLDQVKKIVASIDKSGDGQIDINEFIGAFKKK
ncbi:calhepatin-like [Petromyzon marinus]|uniref:Calmodulin-like n=1 Tax=Petromyzon marinus TaxID=7757 RepID=A0AAJ7UCP5_PETMA|nr:calmodulin-like [Petromyzon marinus]